MMFKHPNVIAASILSVGMLISALLICASLGSLNRTINEKPFAYPTSSAPSEFTVHVRNDVNSPIHLSLANHRAGQDITPIVIQQKP